METVFYLLVAAALGAALNVLRGFGFSRHLGWPQTINAIGAHITAAVLAAIVYFLAKDWLFAILIYGGYVLGESLGWTKWIRTVHGEYSQTYYNKHWFKDKTGVQYMWLIKWMLPAENINYRPYVIFGMMLRGFIWWAPVFAVFWYFAPLQTGLAIWSVVILSVMFPICYKLAYCEGVCRYLIRAEAVYGAVYGLVIGFTLRVTDLIPAQVF